MWVQACRCRCAPGVRQVGEQVVDRVLVEHRGRHVGFEVERCDLAAPQLVEARRRPVVGDARHDLGRGDERVVRAVRHRAVPGRAAHAEPAPRDALLAHRHVDAAMALAAVVETAALGEQVVAADRVGVLVGDPARTVRAAGLLVGDGEVDEVALRPEAAPHERPEHDRHRRREVEHVDRAAAPHLVLALGLRISSPPNGSCRQPSAFTGTTSVWPMRHSFGAVGSVPGMRATNEARPGVGSQRSMSTPAPSTYVCSTSALRVSCPDSAVPSLTHSLRISVCSSSTVSPVRSFAIPRVSHQPRSRHRTAVTSPQFGDRNGVVSAEGVDAQASAGRRVMVADRARRAARAGSTQAPLDASGAGRADHVVERSGRPSGRLPMNA